jgi:hypothetical protein
MCLVMTPAHHTAATTVAELLEDVWTVQLSIYQVTYLHAGRF